MTKPGYKQTPEHIAARIRRGAAHHAWAGDQISEKGGRARALRMYPEISPCIQCGSPRSERHHEDENTANNAPGNVMPLCRRCHMATDSRARAFRAQAVARWRLAVEAAARARRARAICKRGHPLSGLNLYIYRGHRACVQCRKRNKAEYKRRKGQAS